MSSHSPRRILVVDDDEDIVLTVSTVLTDEGYSVVEARDGQQALDAIANDPSIELVLSDIRMPRLDGVEALSRIKKARPDLPVILMTAYAMRDLELRAFHEGVYTIFRKPFDMPQLLGVVARALLAPIILVVDGPVEERDSVLRMVRKYHHHATGAATALEAIEMIRTQVVDVVLMPFTVPDEGLRELDLVRAADASVRIVLITRNIGNDVLQAAAARRIAAWIPQPVAPETLVRLIAEIRAKTS